MHAGRDNPSRSVLGSDVAVDRALAEGRPSAWLVVPKAVAAVLPIP